MKLATPAQTDATDAAESIRRGRRASKLRNFAGAVALAVIGSIGTAHAEKIVFDINCSIWRYDGCASVPQIGTLTLSDSTVDPNRVDFTLAVTPQSQIATLFTLYLNYTESSASTSRYISFVDVSAPAGVVGEEQYNGVFGDNTGPVRTQLDIELNLARSPLAVFSGSLVIRALRGSYVPEPVIENLDAAMFFAKDANDMIYAGLTAATHITTVWYGATTANFVPDAPPIVPVSESLPPAGDGSSPGALVQASADEPGTLALLGLATGFLGWAIRCKKRFNA